VRIEMNMRHGTPPILKAIDLGFNPSLSTHVEVTLTADMFTQMRTAMGHDQRRARSQAREQDWSSTTCVARWCR
jgi:cytosine/adenosine deaminase-related metal-dependent hydrolase